MAEAVARGGAEESRQAGTGQPRPPEGCDSIINISRFLEGEAPFSSSLPLRPPRSLPLLYLSKSLIFCISEEDVNGKEFPLSARAPRGGDAQEAPPKGPEAKVIKPRGVAGGRGALRARSPLPPRAGRDRDPGAAAAASTPRPSRAACAPTRLGGSRGRRPRRARQGRAAAPRRRLRSRGRQGPPAAR